MAGKKKKRVKHSGLSLPRIGASLVPDAIFTAVPNTIQGLAQTWPRKAKSITPLATALGSVGNIAQAVVVASSPRRVVEGDMGENEGHISDENSSSSEDEFSEDHYAAVDETLRRSVSAPEHVMQGSVEGHKPPDEVIYATVNKNWRSQQVMEDLETSSEDDITDVSGMNSDDEPSSQSVVGQPSTSKMTQHKQNNSPRRKSTKRKSKKRSPRELSKSETVEEPVIKADINDNFITAADIPDGLLFSDNTAATQYEPNKGDELSDHEQSVGTRNYHQPTVFEKEQFNETSLEHSTSRESPPLTHDWRRENQPLGSSAPDLVGTTQRPDYGPSHDVPLYEIPPIDQRETPLGKGQSSTESIGMIKESSVQRLEDHVREVQLMLPVRHKLKESTKKKQKRLQETVVEIENNDKQDVTSAEYLGEVGHGGTYNIHEEEEKGGKTLTELPHTDPTSHLKVLDKDHVNETKKKERRRSKKKQMSDVAEELLVNNVLTQHSKDNINGMKEVLVQEGEKTKRRTKKHRDKQKNIENVALVPSVSTSQKLPVETLQQMSLAKETCCKLREQVKVLDQEKSALESLSHSLNNENKTLKKLTQSLSNTPQKRGVVPSVALLQLQNEELKNENNFFKDTLHRLNVELGRYQAKHRRLSPQEMDSMFHSGEKQPAWLMDRKYLAPLLLAYDDQIIQKEDVIKTYEVELQKFKGRLEEIVQENVELRQIKEDIIKVFSGKNFLKYINKYSMQLEEQAKLVLEENAVLMERQKMQNTKIEEMKEIYKEEVSRLSKLLTTCESERDVAKSKVDVMNTSLHEVQQEFGNLSTEWKKRISVEEHVETVNECQRKLESLKKRTEEEIVSLNSQLQNTQNEKDSLASQLADYKLVNAQLEREVHKFNEIQRRNERRTLLLKEKLNHVCDRESTTQDTLGEVLKIAEKTSAERDFLNEMLANQQLEKKKVESLIKREENKLKECQNEAHTKISAIKGRVKEQERVTEMLRDQYENEISSLKVLIRHQQHQLQDMVNEKRNLENELNSIYENIGGEENKKLM